MAMCNHKERLISRLEGILTKQIYNNGKRIRYPLIFDDGSKLKGHGTRLATDNLDVDKFYSVYYKFGANKVYIYKVIRSILDELDKSGVIEEGWSEETYWLYNKD